MRAVRAVTPCMPVSLPEYAYGCVAAGCAAGVEFSSLLAWVAEVQLRYSTNEVAQVRAVHRSRAAHAASG
jgi:hypothetical protein